MWKYKKGSLVLHQRNSLNKTRTFTHQWRRILVLPAQIERTVYLLLHLREKNKNNTETVRKKYGDRTKTIRKQYGNSTETERKQYGNSTETVRRQNENSTETARL